MIYKLYAPNSEAILACVHCTSTERDNVIIFFDSSIHTSPPYQKGVLGNVTPFVDFINKGLRVILDILPSTSIFPAVDHLQL